MTDIVNKVIGLVIAFTLLILAPLTIARMTDDMAAKRLILNETESFIDRVTDKASVSDIDVNDLLIGINSHGIACDAQIVRYTRIAVPDRSRADGVRSVYTASDDAFGLHTVYLERGDAIQVRIKAVAPSTAQRLIAKLMRVYEPNFEFSLAGTVR